MNRRWPVFLLKNLVRMTLLVICISIVTFGLMKASPVDPLQANVGQAALGSMSQEQREKLEEYWGVNTPPVEQYLSWAGDFIRGDMGVSLLYRQPVSRVIAVKLSNSLFLMVMAWILSGILGFVLGVLAGMNQGRLVDATTGNCWTAYVPGLCGCPERTEHRADVTDAIHPEEIPVSYQYTRNRLGVFDFYRIVIPARFMVFLRIRAAARAPATDRTSLIR